MIRSEHQNLDPTYNLFGDGEGACGSERYSCNRGRAYNSRRVAYNGGGRVFSGKDPY